MDFLKTKSNGLWKKFIGLSIIYFSPNYIFAAPPFITDDAAVTEYHHFQSYLYSSAVQGSNATFLSIPTLEMDYGFIPNGEIDLIPQVLAYIPAHGKSTVGLGDTQIKFKYILLNDNTNYPEISIAPAINLPTGNPERNLGWGKPGYILPLWAEKNWGLWTTYGGGGYVINPSKSAKNYIFGGWVLQRNFTERLALGLELYYQGASGTRAIPDAGAVMLANMGASYNLSSSTALQFSMGHNIAGIKLWYGYFGFNFKM